MRKSMGPLSAYVPAREPDRAADGFADPLQHYIIETVAIEERKIRVRQLGIVLALIGGIVVTQWPFSFDSANAVTSVVASAEVVANHIPSISLERLAFAGGLQSGF